FVDRFLLSVGMVQPFRRPYWSADLVPGSGRLQRGEERAGIRSTIRVQQAEQRLVMACAQWGFRGGRWWRILSHGFGRPGPNDHRESRAQPPTDLTALSYRARRRQVAGG